MFLQLESHCEGGAGKSASAHILGMMALQKLSRVEHNDVSNALCLKGSQKVAKGETRDSEMSIPESRTPQPSAD